jgi:hypothetical protein
MAATPEVKVKESINALLKQYGAYKHQPVQNGYGDPCLDYHGCYQGFYLGIEAKSPGSKPTARQISTMNRIARAGGTVFLIDNRNGDDMAQLLAWLLAPCKGFVSKRAQVYIGAAMDQLYSKSGDDDDFSND